MSLTGLAGCAAKPAVHPQTVATDFTAELRALQNRFAPDYHMAVYDVEGEMRGGQLVVYGDVDSAEAHAETLRVAKLHARTVKDEIRELPDPQLGDRNWGLTCLSVANGRENPEHKAEMGTQTLMGEPVRVLKRNGRWLFVQTRDHYLSWMESGSVQLCRRDEVDAWEHSDLLIVTALEAEVREPQRAEAATVSDLVLGDRVQKLETAGDLIKVELPDGRKGFVPQSAVIEYAQWRAARAATPENIEHAARMLLGRPYLWGANSPRGLDCSGFTKLVFFLNGIELYRNASEQARQGVAVPIDQGLGQLKKGDLLFFGFEGGGARRGRISHTGIYLGNQLFIQSSQRVRVSSLDPDSPIADPARIRGLIQARRVLPEN